MWALSQPTSQKLMCNRRSLRVSGLFGGKKDSDKSDDGPGKVYTLPFNC